MITYEMLLESAVLNDIHKKQDEKISYYTVCQDLRELCPTTSKIVKTIIDFRRQNIIEENTENDLKYLILTENGIKYMNELSKELSSQVETMKKYYTHTSDVKNNNVILKNNDNSVEYASFGKNIKETKLVDDKISSGFVEDKGGNNNEK